MHSLETLFTDFIKSQLCKALKGEKMETKKKFNYRAFISTGMIVSGLLLSFSGVINHTLGFEPMSIERHFWMSVHNMSASLFLILTLLHIKLNWRALKNYIGGIKEKAVSKEALSAVLLVLVIITLFSFHAFRVR